MFCRLLLLQQLTKWRMRKRKIPQSGSRILKRKCEPWTDFSEEGQKKLEAMAADMHRILQSQTWGAKLGLSANQGGYKHRVALVLGRFVINPEFQPPKHSIKEKGLEGCYSLGIDNIYEVERHKYGWAKWQDIKGEWHEEKVKGVLAIVFQHELDHLDGKLCHEGGKKVAPPAKK